MKNNMNEKMWLCKLCKRWTVLTSNVQQSQRPQLNVLKPVNTWKNSVYKYNLFLEYDEEYKNRYAKNFLFFPVDDFF